MADFLGFRLAQFEGPAPSDIVPVAQTAGKGYALFQPGLFALPTIRSGVFADGAGIPIESFTGSIYNGQQENFYNSVVITPSVLNVGSITETSQFAIQFFNGFLHQSEITLASFVSSDPNITLIGRGVGSTFTRLENYAYTIQVLAGGVGDIDETLTWTFNNGYSLVYRVIGTRTAVLAPQPEVPAVEILSFSSLVRSTYSSEFRGSFRAHPRHSINYRFLLWGEELTRFYANILESNFANFTFPIWSQPIPIGAFPIGTTTLPIGSDDYDLEVNSSLFIYDSFNGNETVTVLTVSPTEITINPLTIEHTNQTFAIPTITGFLRQAPTFVQRNNDITEVSITIEALTFYRWADSSTANFLAFYGWEQIGDVFVWPFGNCEFGGVNVSTFVDRSFLDNTSGLVQRVRQSTQNREYSSLNVLLSGESEVTRFKRFLYLLQGQSETFYLPTDRPDLTVLSTNIALNAGAVDLVNAGLSAYGSTTRGVQFQFTDGTVFNTLATFTSGSTSLLLATNFPREIVVATELLRVSFLNLFRLNQDDITINHVENGRATCALQLVNPI